MTINEIIPTFPKIAETPSLVVGRSPDLSVWNFLQFNKQNDTGNYHSEIQYNICIVKNQSWHDTFH